LRVCADAGRERDLVLTRGPSSEGGHIGNVEDLTTELLHRHIVARDVLRVQRIEARRRGLFETCHPVSHRMDVFAIPVQGNV